MNESRIFVRDIKENRKHDGGGECDKTIRIKTVEMYITLNLSTRRGNIEDVLRLHDLWRN